MDFLNNLGINSISGLFGLALFAIGGFIFLAGVGIISIEKVTVKQGRTTWIIGLLMPGINGFLLYPDFSPKSSISTTNTTTQDSMLSPNSKLVEIKESPIDNMVQVYISAGNFLMGNEDGDFDEEPIHEVYLDAFWIDQHEVTNEQYTDFLNTMGNQEEGGDTWFDETDRDVFIEKVSDKWSPIEGYADHPVAEVTWYGALAYCNWANRRLPTEAEWEKAARGDLYGKTYPWGDEKPICENDLMNSARFDDDNFCNDIGSAQVMSYSPNGFKLYDMAGNVWEWVSD